MLAIVTGSAKGIGKELIIKLSEKGYDVIITYNNSKNEAELLKNYVETNYGINADILKCDISKEEEIISLRDYIINKYGKLDILINNAALSIDNSIDEKTKEEFMKVLEVNVVGTFLVSKYLYKYMDNGIIVNISSTDAEDTFSTLNIDYSASKAGINIITKTMALELKNVKVIGVMPNWTNTESIKEMNPDYLKSELERIGQEKIEEPEEVASNILKLVFDNNIKSGEIRRV